MNFVGTLGAAVAAAMLLLAQPAAAKCGDHGGCAAQKTAKTQFFNTKRTAAKSLKAKRTVTNGLKAKRTVTRGLKAKRIVLKAPKAKKALAKQRKAKRRKSTVKITSASYSFTIRSKSRTSTRGLALPKTFEADTAPISGNHGSVVAMISGMAPSYGVPGWFALRIAKVESGYNPRLRGRAGEYGVFQIKCPTARGLGFGGNCSQLSDARTNVRWGLAHLSAALKSSGGNLRLAASKHNGGLGRRSLIRGYVAKIF